MVIDESCGGWPAHRKIPEDQYPMKIVTGKELKIGDNIVHEGVRVIIQDVCLGKGAGNWEFGEYVSVEIENKKFWIFENSPIVLL